MTRAMPLQRRRATLCGLLAALSLPALAAEGSLAQVAWLAGCWQADGGEAGSVEQWMAPAGGAMLGMGRTVKAGRMSTFEFMQIREAATGGGIEFHAMPAGQAPATFPAKAVSAGEVTFENPAHDFPQRIVYWKDGNDLRARIEGTMNGKPGSEEWRWSPGALK